MEMTTRPDLFPLFGYRRLSAEAEAMENGKMHVYVGDYVCITIPS
jgi:hypothetical protein